MDLSEQKKKFYASVSPSRPNSWEVDEVFDVLAELDEESSEALLAHVGAIWPISHSLCFSYLTDGVKALEFFSVDLLDEWVRQILGLYESRGLLGARRFMADVDKYFLGPMRGETGVAFEEISARMVHYLRGISGRSFELDIAQVPSTDTKTIFLPGFLDTFPGKQNNIFLYKFLLSLQWGNVESRIFAEAIIAEPAPQDLFSEYPDRQLAKDLLSALQFVKVFRYLELELPGLVRQGRELCHLLIKHITAGDGDKDKCIALQNLLIEHVCTGADTDRLSLEGGRNEWMEDEGVENRSVLDTLPGVYRTFAHLSGSYSLGAASLLLGEFDFVRARQVITLRREEEKEKFVAMLAGLLEQHSAEQNEEGEGGNTPKSLSDNLFLLMQEQHGEKSMDDKFSISLNNEGLEIPEELAALIKEIKDDLGGLPEAYVQAAAGQAGGGINRRESVSPEEVRSFSPVNSHSYDEWDYRRAGYRAGWCSLIEKTLHPVRSGFVTGTLKKYRPHLNKMRRQFEMLRNRDRFVRRRRHGDDIDLDALIEALGDTRAGRAPSDRLFVQLLRDERDIAAMFLVDMSNSTEGWVGVAIKESLVLLAEALEVVGDSYGIYGFSGMRRSKSELYHIKHFDEPYSVVVQGRIAAIAPKEYTRVGPPIRHLTKKLLETKSTVRLLVLISDGKPEDYDDYKGQYAIEDTRKALLEARGNGVYPFCITIDKSAHDYLTHMFGVGNYIFVDKVTSLPAKMAEMYRLLTS
ncbi:MAG: VWA domain-containing protein [Desulforhopalus sp.]